MSLASHAPRSAQFAEVRWPAGTSRQTPASRRADTSQRDGRSGGWVRGSGGLQV
jgi:hypothetical protein